MPICIKMAWRDAKNRITSTTDLSYVLHAVDAHIHNQAGCQYKHDIQYHLATKWKPESQVQDRRQTHQPRDSH
jgi:hypothetical protein